MTDETRRMPPFGSPTREGQHERTRRRNGGVASSQVDPPHGGTGVRVQRHRRWPGLTPLRLPECVDTPPPLASAPPTAALREVRLNGFPGALAEVLLHGVGGGVRRVPDAAPTGVLDARFVVEPAYSASSHRFTSSCVP